MDKSEREAFERAWMEASPGLDRLFDADQISLLHSLGAALFSAGTVHGCRRAYDHALEVATRAQRVLGAVVAGGVA